MKLRKYVNDTLKIMTSLLFGGLILFWMYRDFDFRRIGNVLFHEMHWTWMLLSFPFGILAQLFRGWRWRMTLEPLGERPRTSTCINSIFFSYASSLVVPRIGEFARCGILSRYDGVSFPKALGTVVTERAIDSLLVITITVVTILLQMNVFDTFFTRTGTNIDNFVRNFSPTGYLVTALCAIATLVLIWYLLRKFSIYNKVKSTIGSIWQGVSSLRNVRDTPLFAFYTIAIWLSYFMHYYLAFFCFEATSHLSVSCAIVTFIVGSIAVIVPTPNGAGPWHFAVKIMLMLYGVAETDALYFVLIVHSIQTMLVVLLGIYAWIALLFTARRENKAAT